jgi:hypothetical protein
MKTVIEMAREAAAVHGHTFKAVPSPETIEFITAFAELVRADEREACAVIAETPISGEQDDITMEAKDRVATAIRARGNT